MEPIGPGGDGTTTVVVDDVDRTVKRVHPFRGLFWGLLLGIGLAGVLIVTTTITASVLAIVAVVVAGLVVGIVWGLAGPTRQAKGPPPPARLVVEQAPTSRFDDFDRPPADATSPAPPAPPLPPPPPPGADPTRDPDDTR